MKLNTIPYPAIGHKIYAVPFALFSKPILLRQFLILSLSFPFWYLSGLPKKRTYKLSHPKQQELSHPQQHQLSHPEQHVLSPNIIFGLPSNDWQYWTGEQLPNVRSVFLAFPVICTPMTLLSVSSNDSGYSPQNLYIFYSLRSVLPSIPNYNIDVCMQTSKVWLHNSAMQIAYFSSESPF